MQAPATAWEPVLRQTPEGRALLAMMARRVELLALVEAMETVIRDELTAMLPALQTAAAGRD